MIKPGTLFADRYEIVEKIGSGGMADVYKANDMRLNRQVAVKILKANLAEDMEFVRRFRVEGRAAASLNNPNIVSIFDVGNVGNIHYIVMELIDGITLKEYIRRKGMLSPRETMAITAQVAVGLRTAHAKHIVHRDIKPQNIVLSRDGKVKVTDFGIARAITDETKTINNTAMGSVHYIAPEQAKGQMCDERSDIYSLGICMYEMIAGQVPFDKETSIAVALAHMNETMVPPSRINPNCPTALEQIIFRCTQKSRDRRYHNCTELLADLKVAVASPDFNFEKKEQEDLLKSDTLVFSPEEVEAVRRMSSGAGYEKATTIVDGRNNGANVDTGTLEIPTVVRHVDRNRLTPAEYDRDGLEEANRPVVRKRNDLTEADTEDERPARRAFQEENPEEEKSMFDKVMVIIGVVLGALMLSLLIYLVASLSGCVQSTRATKPSTTDTQTLPPEEEIVLVTIPVENFDPEVQTIVPNVKGMPLKQAIETLRSKDLEYKISTVVVYSDEYSIGVICDQSYPEGTVVKKQSIIVITLSAGTDKFEIKSNYIGGPLNIFKNDVSKYEDIFDIEYVKVFSETVGINRIISIEPASGIVKSGDHIVVTYSAGPEYVAVPNLLNYSRVDAEHLLADHALLLGNFTEDYSEEVEENHIMGQQYEPGTVVRNGSTVDVVISKGVQIVQLPDVLGMNIDEAKAYLESEGFIVEAEEGIDENAAPGEVIGMNPESDSYVKYGETIYLTYKKEQWEGEMTNLVGSSLEQAQKMISDIHLVCGDVVYVDTTNEEENGIIISQSPEAYSWVKEGDRVNVEVGRYVTPTQPTEPTQPPTQPTEPTEPTEPPTQPPTQPTEPQTEPSSSGEGA